MRIVCLLRVLVLGLMSALCHSQSLVLLAKAALPAATLLRVAANAAAATSWCPAGAAAWPGLLLPAGAPGESGAVFALLAGPLAASERECVLQPAAAAAGTEWRCASVGTERELRFGDKLFLRTATGFDPAQLEASFKSFQHLFAADTATQLTKGAGGKHSHHRGLFLGWNQATIDGRTFDFWHGKEGVSIRHKRFRDDLAAAGAACVRLGVENEWCLADGTPVVQELRVLTAFRCGAARALDVQIGLRALGQPVSMRGDAHHAGLHVRAADEVAEREADTQLLLDAAHKPLGNDLHSGAAWCAASFKVGQQPCTFLLIDHPSNGSTVMSVRTYGRIGFMPEVDLVPDQTRVLRWRLLVFDGAAPCAATCAQLTEIYRKPPVLTWS